MYEYTVCAECACSIHIFVSLLLALLLLYVGLLSLCAPNSGGAAAFVSMLPLVESSIQVCACAHVWVWRLFWERLCWNQHYFSIHCKKRATITSWVNDPNFCPKNCILEDTWLCIAVVCTCRSVWWCLTVFLWLYPACKVLPISFSWSGWWIVLSSLPMRQVVNFHVCITYLIFPPVAGICMVLSSMPMRQVTILHVCIT